MVILSTIIQLMGGVSLLMFAIWFLRAGIERSFGAWIRRRLSNPGWGGLLLANGCFLGFAMQGATAVILLSASLAGSSVITLSTATLIALGAELGSALAVAFLQLNISLLAPLIIIIGGSLFLKTERTTKSKWIGQTLLGLGLVLISLDLIKTSVSGIDTSEPIRFIVDGIGNDPVNGVLLGLLLTFLMHSSLAALLTLVAVFAARTVDPEIILSLVIGCNIGSALLPVWLMRSVDHLSKAVAQSVAVLRIIIAAILLAALFLHFIPFKSWISEFSNIQIFIFGHLGFNLLLLLLSPFVKITNALFVSGTEPFDNANTQFELKSDAPELAVADFKRRVNRMLETLSNMMFIATSRSPEASKVAQLEKQTNATLTQLRENFALMPDYQSKDVRQIRDILEYAVKLERCADLFSGKYLNIRQEERDGKYQLTDKGAEEIKAILEQLSNTLAFAQKVFWNENPSDARELVRQKQDVSTLEKNLRQKHLERIRNGDTGDLNSSDQYLEMAAMLKEINSKLATYAYVILDRHDELNSTRVKELVVH